MKKLLKGLWRLKYLALGIALFCLLDAYLTRLAPVEHSTRFTKNDYEISVLSHGGQTSFDKVLCGSSTAVNGYIERLSHSGFVNFGLAYGKITDIQAMLEGGYLDVREELVINMADLIFSDTIATNPSYPWHRGRLEPYVYFQRDRISPVLGPALENLLRTGKLFSDEAPELPGKYVVYGRMTPEEIAESLRNHSENYWPALAAEHGENLAALDWVCRWCREHGVRLRTFWCPLNPDAPIVDEVRGVMDEVNALLDGYGVEHTDMTDLLPPECFYDIGHLNQDVGAVRFTEVLDEWLLS